MFKINVIQENNAKIIHQLSNANKIHNNIVILIMINKHAEELQPKLFVILYLEKILVNKPFVHGKKVNVKVLKM